MAHERPNREGLPLPPLARFMSRSGRQGLSLMLAATMAAGWTAGWAAPAPEPPASGPATAEKPASIQADRDACRKNLERINAAIQAYANEHRELPDWLSDLVPKYLPDSTALICPVSRQTGLMPTSRLADPEVPSSYLYQLCPVPLGNLAPDTPKQTWREWKRRQTKLAGTLVPMVRCLQHEPVLNLGLDGQIVDSPLFWEELVTNRLSPEALAPTSLFPKEPTSDLLPEPALPTRPPPPEPKSLLRLAVWRLEPAATNAPSGGSNTLAAAVAQAAAALKPLAADVILLRQVRDWAECERLARALQPAAYHVAACSAFRDPWSGALQPAQVGILSRYPAGFSWWRAWPATNGLVIPGGYALAAIQVGSQTLAVFNLHLSDALARAYLDSARTPAVQLQGQVAAIQQWLSEVETFKHWTTNPFNLAVVAGAFDLAEPTRRARLSHHARTFLSAPFDQVVTATSTTDPVPRITARLPAPAQAIVPLVLETCPALCELTLSPATPPASLAASPQAPHGEEPASAASANQAHGAPGSNHLAATPPPPPPPPSEEHSAMPATNLAAGSSPHTSGHASSTGHTNQVRAALANLGQLRAVRWWGLGSFLALLLVGGSVWVWRKRRAKKTISTAQPTIAEPPPEAKAPAVEPAPEAAEPAQAQAPGSTPAPAADPSPATPVTEAPAAAPTPTAAAPAPPAPTLTPAAAPEPTLTPATTPEPTLTPAITPIATPAPTLTPVASPTLTPVAEPTLTPRRSPTLTPVAAPTPTSAPTPAPAKEPAPPEPTPVTAQPAATAEPEPDLSQVLQEEPSPEQVLEQRLTDLTLQLAMAKDEERDALQAQMSQLMGEMAAMEAARAQPASTPAPKA